MRSHCAHYVPDSRSAGVRCLRGDGADRIAHWPRSRRRGWKRRSWWGGWPRRLRCIALEGETPATGVRGVQRRHAVRRERFPWGLYEFLRDGKRNANDFFGERNRVYARYAADDSPFLRAAAYGRDHPAPRMTPRFSGTRRSNYRPAFLGGRPSPPASLIPAGATLPLYLKSNGVRDCNRARADLSLRNSWPY